MKNLSLIALCTLVFASCQQADELVSPTTTTQLVPRSQHERPFQADLAGTLNLDSEPTGCTGDLPLALLDYFISGNATHMGLLDTESSFLHHEDCNLSFETALLTTSVSGQLAAANGELVYYAGDDVIDVFNLLTASGSTGPITGTWTITGGTGRFEDATGSITISGIVDFITLSFTAEANGTITY